MDSGSLFIVDLNLVLPYLPVIPRDLSHYCVTRWCVFFLNLVWVDGWLASAATLTTNHVASVATEIGQRFCYTRFFPCESGDASTKQTTQYLHIMTRNFFGWLGVISILLSLVGILTAGLIISLAYSIVSAVILALPTPLTAIALAAMFIWGGPPGAVAAIGLLLVTVSAKRREKRHENMRLLPPRR